MKKPTDYYKGILETLKELKANYPNMTLGQHLHLALEDYNLWDTTDKEVSFALDKYAASREIDHTQTNLDKIYNDSINLDVSSFFQDEEEEEDF